MSPWRQKGGKEGSQRNSWVVTSLGTGENRRKSPVKSWRRVGHGTILMEEFNGTIRPYLITSPGFQAFLPTEDKVGGGEGPGKSTLAYYPPRVQPIPTSHRPLCLSLGLGPESA